MRHSYQNVQQLWQMKWLYLNPVNFLQWLQMQPSVRRITPTAVCNAFTPAITTRNRRDETIKPWPTELASHDREPRTQRLGFAQCAQWTLKYANGASVPVSRRPAGQRHVDRSQCTRTSLCVCVCVACFSSITLQLSVPLCRWCRLSVPQGCNCHTPLEGLWEL